MHTTMTMISRGRRFALVTSLILLVAGAVGCGSDVGGAACLDESECPDGWSCAAGICQAPGDPDSSASGDTRADAGNPWHGDVIETPDVVSDTGLEDVVPDTAADIQGEDITPELPNFDSLVPDLMPDHTPPVVVSISPEDGLEGVGLDFVVRVEFDEEIRPTTIVAGETFQLTDVAGLQVAGEIAFTPDDRNVTGFVFTPSQAIMVGSPYHVQLSPTIMDQSGNRLGEFYRVSFFTEPYPVPDSHHEVAGRYAPRILQETAEVHPERDYLTALDFDRDWDLSNNAESLAEATALRPVVYYAVAETRSHWFITYMFYHPVRREGFTSGYTNDLSGAQVVVARHPVERPVMVQTYFKEGDREDVFGFATIEAGFGATDMMNDVYPEAELFPGGRFTALLTADRHQSCAAIDLDNSAPPNLCIFSSATLESGAFIEYVYEDGTADAILRGDDGFPRTADEPVAYELTSVHTRLWPRRAEVVPAGTLFEESFTFDSNLDPTTGQQRPGLNADIGSRFVGSAADGTGYGRPAWAWGWAPTAGQKIDVAAGTMFLDPAYLVWKRLLRPPRWSEGDPSGFSLDYCLNPYLNLNFSFLPECQ